MVKFDFEQVVVVVVIQQFVYEWVYEFDVYNGFDVMGDFLMVDVCYNVGGSQWQSCDEVLVFYCECYECFFVIVDGVFFYCYVLYNLCMCFIVLDIVEIEFGLIYFIMVGVVVGCDYVDLVLVLDVMMICWCEIDGYWCIVMFDSVLSFWWSGQSFLSLIDV